MLTADYSTIEQISARLIESSDALGRMVEGVAKARQIRDYDSDRRKRALAAAVRDAVNTDIKLSGAAAEHVARASESYGETMKALAKDLIRAEQEITAWEAEKIKWETARSLLSVQKTIAGTI